MHHPALEKLRTTGAGDLGKLALRLAVGAAFLSHGWMKVQSLPFAVMYFGKIHIPAPGFFAPFVSWIEVLGGAALILGAAVRFFGAALAIDMLVAIVANKHYAAWKSAELEALLLASSLMLLTHGAGRWSLDALLMKKLARAHSDAMPAKT